MIYDNRINVSEGINLNKTSESKECDICHYWYFLSKCFKLQLNVCNRCHDLLIMSMNLSNIAILNIKGAVYRRIISGISKNKNLLSHINMGKEILAFGDTEIDKINFTDMKVLFF